MFSIKLDESGIVESIEPQFYPQNWQVYDAVTDSPQEATGPDGSQVTETVDDIKEEEEGDEWPVIEEVNPDDYLPANEGIIVKSEEDGTLSFQLPISEKLSPPKAESRANDTNGNVSKEAEIKDEEEAEEGPVIEEINPDDYPMSPRDGNAGQHAEMGVEASQLTVDAFSGTTDNESNLFEPAYDNEDDEDPIIEEVNPDDYPLSPRRDNASQMAATVSSASPLVLRRSSRVGKSAVKYSLHSELEEETPQDEPNTDTSDSDESESEADSEMETDDPREAEESASNATKTFPCRQCGKRFSFRNNARRHEKSVHTQTERPRPYVCSLADCGAAFLCKTSLDKHRFLHTGLRQFTCSTCGASFKQKTNLKSHQSTHTTERPYACTICLKAFKMKQTLVQHTMIHSGLKPFTCADCGKSFTEKSNLKAHQKRKAARARKFASSESRPFSCSVAGCGKAFKSRKNLNAHQLTHSGLKVFKCSVCSRDFARKENLQNHSRKIHAI